MARAVRVAVGNKGVRYLYDTLRTWLEQSEEITGVRYLYDTLIQIKGSGTFMIQSAHG